MATMSASKNLNFNFASTGSISPQSNKVNTETIKEKLENKATSKQDLLNVLSLMQQFITKKENQQESLANPKAS